MGGLNEYEGEISAMPQSHITHGMLVGDRVRVGRACLGNPADAVAVCYQVYDRGDGTTGVSLLFPSGSYDGFSPRDADLFGLERIDHIPALAAYQFTDVGRLDRDFHAGVFAAAWLTPLPDPLRD
jgi:hypothetical protein